MVLTFSYVPRYRTLSAVVVSIFLVCTLVAFQSTAKEKSGVSRDSVVETLGEDRARIKSWDSHITIHNDSSVTVEEEYHVHFAESGLLTFDLALKSRRIDNSGDLVKLNYTNIEAYVDGVPTEVGIKDYSNFRRVRVEPQEGGGTSKIISSGGHTYKIKYSIEGALDFCDSYDKLVWDPEQPMASHVIENVNIKISLPQGIAKGDVHYAGAVTRKNADRNNRILGGGGVFSTKSNKLKAVPGKDVDYDHEYTASFDEVNNRIVFNSNYVLPKSRALNISLGWPQGHVMRTAKEVFMTPVQRQLLTMGVIFLGAIVFCLGCYFRLRYLRSRSGIGRFVFDET